MSAKKTTAAAAAGAGSAAAVISVALAFTPMWEGMDKVARRDAIGTGHPVTYCYGQTDEFGSVKVGQRFTKKECDAKLAQSLPRYLAEIDRCIRVPLPVKTRASLLDAAYNAGAPAVCRSPMVRKMNGGDIAAGCRAFQGWYVRSDGVVRTGLIARRGHEKRNDPRKSEMELCLEGFVEGLPKPAKEPFWLSAWHWITGLFRR